MIEHGRMINGAIMQANRGGYARKPQERGEEN